jgi:hypothetical protein
MYAIVPRHGKLHLDVDLPGARLKRAAEYPG